MFWAFWQIIVKAVCCIGSKLSLGCYVLKHAVRSPFWNFFWETHNSFSKANIMVKNYSSFYVFWENAQIGFYNHSIFCVYLSKLILKCYCIFSSEAEFQLCYQIMHCVKYCGGWLIEIFGGSANFDMAFLWVRQDVDLLIPLFRKAVRGAPRPPRQRRCLKAAASNQQTETGCLQ